MTDASLRIRTQPATDEFGIPDIRIESEHVDVVVEVKTGSPGAVPGREPGPRRGPGPPPG